MNRTLKARLAKLERRTIRPEMPRTIIALCPQEEAGEIVGYLAGNLHILREPNESAKDCASRAFSLAPSCLYLVAMYAKPARSAVEREERLAARWATPEPPPPPDEPEIDPYAVGQPGIGSIASRELLERMGAVPVPFERLI